MKTFSPPNVMTKKLMMNPIVRTPRPTGPAALSIADVTPDRIRIRAYEIYEARTANGGAMDPVADWVQAERELKCKAMPEKPASAVEVKAQVRGEQLLASDE